MVPAAAAPALARLHAEVSEVVAEGARLALRAPPPWAALLVGVGVLYMLHGARERHVLAAPGGAALGLLAARLIVTALDGPGAAVQVEALWVAAGVGALVCAGWPPLFPALALALPAAAVGAWAGLAGRGWMGAAAGLVLGGALGALLREWVAALAAGGLGAAAAVAGALALLSGRPIAGELVERPFALAAVWVVLTVAGAAFHAGRAWPRPGARASEVEGVDAAPEKTAWDSRGADR